jgi:hypothetical protein
MKCKECCLDLYDFRDGRLSAERVNLIRLHLEDCTSCRELYLQEMELSRTFHETANRVGERLHFQFPPANPRNRKPVPASNRLSSPVMKWATAAAIVAIVAVCATILVLKEPRPSTVHIARLARSGAMPGTKSQAGNQLENEKDLIQVISIEDDSDQLNETHFRQEKDGMIYEITVEVTAVRLAGQTKG